MTEQRERQSQLVPPDKTETGTGTTKRGMDNKTRMVLTGVAGIAGAVALDAALTGGPEHAMAQDADETPTPTPEHSANLSGMVNPNLHFGHRDEDADADVTPTLTPTVEPGETMVAVVSTETSPEVTGADLAKSLEGFPNRIVTDSTVLWQHMEAEINFNTIKPIVGTDGKLITPGYYRVMPDNIDPSLLPPEMVINGVKVDKDMVVGFVVMGNYNNQPLIQVGFPKREVAPNGQILKTSDQNYAVEEFMLDSHDNIFRAANPDGSLTAPSGENGGLSLGTDIVWDKDKLTLTFTDGDGNRVTIHNGDEIMIPIFSNFEKVWPRPAATNGESRTYQQMLTDIMDTDPSNDRSPYLDTYARQLAFVVAK